VVTTRQFKSFSLVLAVLIAVSLATSTPPSSEVHPDDHFGMLLHPMYWHAHS
jgi:hypothetical protein